jgi:hypothetical protein
MLASTGSILVYQTPNHLSSIFQGYLGSDRNTKPPSSIYKASGILDKGFLMSYMFTMVVWDMMV